MTTMNQLRAWKAVRRRFVTVRVRKISCPELRNLSDRSLGDIGAPRRGNERPPRPELFYWIPSIF
jgi:uncharacterized protein YjiS (DUF1127 family)